MMKMTVKNTIAGQHVSREMKERSRELRHTMTPAEKVLWNELRGDKLGVRFRRQQVIEGCIVDFYCYQASLVIELDGGIHDVQEQKISDFERDDILRALGLRVKRFKNEQVLHELSQTLSQIRELIDSPLLPKAPRAKRSGAGEGPGVR